VGESTSVLHIYGLLIDLLHILVILYLMFLEGRTNSQSILSYVASIQSQLNMLQLMTSVKYKAILQSVAVAGKISVTTNDATHD
jgi:hypothetical protein